MNAKPRHFWTCSSRAALTLVEVVASLALLGTLLVGILVAHRRHVEQIHLASARIEAAQAADDLLLKWSAEGTWGAVTSTGIFEGRDDLVWRWSVIPSPQLRQMGAAIGRLEVFAAVTSDERPLSSVEVITTSTF